jgi:hypothetical protein
MAYLSYGDGRYDYYVRRCFCMVMEVELAEYLEDGGIGTVGSTIFVGMLPDNIDSCIGVFPMGGLEPIKAFSNGATRHVMDVGIAHIQVRNTSYSTGRSKISAIKALLDAVVETTIEAVVYHSIDAVSSEPATFRDEKNRVHFTQKFKVVKERS